MSFLFLSVSFFPPNYVLFMFFSEPDIRRSSSAGDGRAQTPARERGQSVKHVKLSPGNDKMTGG